MNMLPVVALLSASYTSEMNSDTRSKCKRDHRHLGYRGLPKGIFEQISKLHYGAYFKEVTNTILEDQTIKLKLGDAVLQHKVLKLSQILESAQTKTRENLNAAKRSEYDRLLVVIREEGRRYTNAVERKKVLKYLNHLNMYNRNVFEIVDLKKLLLSACQDLKAHGMQFPGSSDQVISSQIKMSRSKN